MAFNPAGNSLIVGSRAGRLAEVSIPIPVNSSNVNALPFASFLQPFSDPTEGRLWQVSPDGGAGIDGLLVHGGRLYGTATIYYDASNTQRVSHYSHSLQLSEPSFQGWSQVWETGKTGFVSGFMAAVPSEWRSRLGGPAVTGQCCIPIVTRTSWGPAAFAFDPALVGQATVPASPLLYYTGQYPSLGHWNGSNPTYGATISMGGLVIVANTRTALFFGRNGLGEHCYGNGTSDPALHNTTGPDGALWCYDPTSSDKGSHAYPYRYQIWAYDLNDFAAVNAGTKQPWEVLPYGVWPFELPTAEPSVRIGSVAYDPHRQMIYLAQMYADKDVYSYRPIIHAMQVNVPPVPNDPPPPTGPLTSVGLTTDMAAPQQSGTTIRATAAPAGGATPHQYKWWIHNGAAWTAASDWTTSSQHAWTPTSPNANYQIAVWARSAGNTNDVPEVSAAIPFAIEGGQPSTGPLTGVVLAANLVSPQPPGTAIVWTATPSGGSAHQYKWWSYDGVTWTIIGDWSTSNVFTWTPAAANPNYRVGVWVRANGNTVDAAQVSTSNAFPTAADTPPPASSRVTAITIVADRAAPQAAGTTVLWTAAATGGTGPLQYKWWTYDGRTWVVAGAWTASNTFAWTPTAANPAYKVGIWVRSAGNSTDEAETSTSEPFAIDTAAQSPSGPVTSVRLTADRSAPLTINNVITWTATPTAGVAPHQYKWWVFNGESWVALTAWTTSNTFRWTPTKPNRNYRIGVWVRSATATADTAEATATEPFPITRR